MPTPADIHALLAQADWLRRLARQLVTSDQEAEDAVQETWVAALRSPPDSRRPARPWLAAVLRNFVRKQGGRSARRRRREAELVSEGSAGSPEDLLASLETQRLLVDLVLALDEPYRSAVLLRYYGGLEPAHIAEELGIAAGTMRWRLSEGLSRLRKELDDRFAKRGFSWRWTLAPTALWPSTRKAAFVVMTAKTKIGVAIALAMAFLVGGRIVWRQIAGARQSSGRPMMAAVEKSGAARSTAPRGLEIQATRSAAVAGTDFSPHPAPPRFVTAKGGSTTDSPNDNLAASSASSGPGASSGEQHGTMSKDDIRTGIRSIMPGLKDCYSRLLEREPQASGRIAIEFTIVEREGVGRISDATIVPTQRDGGTPELIEPLAEQCMLNAVAGAHFVAPVGGPVVITYPFLLTPSHVPFAPSPRAQ